MLGVEFVAEQALSSYQIAEKFCTKGTALAVSQNDVHQTALAAEVRFQDL